MVQCVLSAEPGARLFDVTTLEDLVLHKLDPAATTGGVSDRQWHDVVGVLAVQGDALAQAYLRRWAGALGVADLLDRALAEAQDDQRDSK